MKTNYYSTLNDDIYEQNIESQHDRHDDFEDLEPEWPKYEKISSKQLEKGKWFYDLLSSKDGVLSDLPQNFVHNLKETHWSEGDISKEFDTLTKQHNITLLPWKVDVNNLVSEDGDTSYYVLTFQGKKDGVESKHSITISHMWDLDIYPNTEITKMEKAIQAKEIVSETNERLDNLQREIREVIESREN